MTSKLRTTWGVFALDDGWVKNNKHHQSSQSSSHRVRTDAYLQVPPELRNRPSGDSPL